MTGRAQNLTTGEAARRIADGMGWKVSTAQVRHWIDVGLLDGRRVGDSWYRVSEKGVEDFIEANTDDTLDSDAR
jgi:DNA-binding transcriptional MerR regulator